MKRTGFDHPKHGRLCRLLKIDHAYSVGIVESILQVTARHAQRGDIGKWSNEEIAAAIGVSETPADELITALVEAKWLDRHDECRLIVHDWDEHCEDSIHLALARKIEHFANGNRPKLTRLNKTERPEIEALYEVKERAQRQADAQNTHEVHTEHNSVCTETRARPSRSPAKPEPKPRPSSVCTPDAPDAKPGAGVFERITPELLRDGPALSRWHTWASSKRKPVIGNSEQDRIRVFSAAERALEDGENPPSLFAYIVGKRQWQLISQSQEDRASARFRELQARNRGAPPDIVQDLAASLTQPLDD